MKTKGSKKKKNELNAAKAVARKSVAKKPAAKTAPKKSAKKQVVSKKAAPKKAAPKPKKAAPRPKVTLKPNVAPKPKAEPRVSKAAKLAPAKVVAPVPAAPAPIAEPVRAAETPKVVPASTETASLRSKSVVRIAGGRARGGQHPASNGTTNGAASGHLGSNGPHPVSASGAPEGARAVGGRFEVNPKLESTRGKIRTPPPAAMVSQTVKGMTVAEKRRAEAEAMFQQYAKPGSVAPTPTPPPTPGAGGNGGAPATGVDEYGRFSHRDSLMTMLRMAVHRSQALEAATELADKYQLPADQALLLKVIDLGEARLTKLALEELLELDDRGRVRPNDHLRASLARVEPHDPETRELKDLLIAKVGVRV